MKEGFPGVSLLMFPEMKLIKSLLDRARRGISFDGNTKKAVGKKIEKLSGMIGMEKFIAFLDILKDVLGG